MTNEPSPRPWRVNTPMTSAPWKEGNPHIYDAKGVGVAIVGIGKSPDVNSAIAALIVDAVNERDRLRLALKNLRDASRNFYHEILNSPYSKILDKYTCVEQGFPSVLALNAAVPDANIVLTESDDSDMARAALGEDKP